MKVSYVITGMKDIINLTPELMVFLNPVSGMFNLKFLRLDSKGE